MQCKRIYSLFPTHDKAYHIKEIFAFVYATISLREAILQIACPWFTNMDLIDAEKSYLGIMRACQLTMKNTFVKKI